MNIGLVCWSFSQGMRVGAIRDGFDLVKAAAQLGADGIGIDHAFLPHPDDHAQIRQLRAQADDAGTRITAGVSGADDLVAAIRNGEGDALFERAQTLGSDVLKTTFAPPGVRLEEGWDIQTSRERVQAAIQALVEIEPTARRHNLPVAIENHIDFTNEELLEIWASTDSPYVGLLFDTANQFALLDNGAELGQELLDRILSVHFKDGYSVPTEDGVDLIWCVPGTGIADAPAAAALLKQKPNLTINVETIVTQQWAVPYKTAEFWSSLSYGRDDRADIIAAMEAQASENRSRPPVGDEELLAFETEQLKLSMAAARKLFQADGSIGSPATSER